MARIIGYRSAEASLIDILWYNGYLGSEEDLKPGETYLVDDLIKLLDETIKGNYEPMHGFLGADDISNYCKCPRIDEWGSEEHCIYMLLVGMFGNWGTSIRSGWLEKYKECKEFLEGTKAYMLTDYSEENN